MNGDPLYNYLLWQASRPRGDDAQGVRVVTADTDAVARQCTLIRRTLAHPDAHRMAPDPATVNEVIARLRDETGGAEALAAALEQAGLDFDALHRAIAAELQAGQLLDQVMADVTVDEATVRAYYEHHRERMVRPEVREASHILITLNDDYPENTRPAVEQRLAEVERALRAGESTLAELALRHSECPSALEDGRMGKVVRGKLYPTLEEALFGLEAGGIAAPVESPLGLHLLRCDAIEPAGTVDYAEAAPRIRQRLEERARQARVREWLRAAPPADNSAADT